MKGVLVHKYVSGRVSEAEIDATVYVNLMDRAIRYVARNAERRHEEMSMAASYYRVLTWFWFVLFALTVWSAA